MLRKETLKCLNIFGKNSVTNIYILKRFFADQKGRDVTNVIIFKMILILYRYIVNFSLKHLKIKLKYLLPLTYVKPFYGVSHIKAREERFIRCNNLCSQSIDLLILLLINHRLSDIFSWISDKEYRKCINISSVRECMKYEKC